MIKEKYETLLKTADVEDQEFIYDYMNAFRKYVNAVIRMGIRLPLIRMRKMPEDFQYESMQMDFERKLFHEAAIDACNILNRFSEQLGLPVFFEGDTTDRYAVADFCMEVCQELFMEGQRKSIMEMIDCREEVPALKREA